VVVVGVLEIAVFPLFPSIRLRERGNGKSQSQHRCSHDRLQWKAWLGSRYRKERSRRSSLSPLLQGQFRKAREGWPLLYSLGRANDTVLNKLSCIVTWLKRNGLVSIVGLLPADERPERRETEGQPLSETEVDKVMEIAGEHKLLLRLAYNAGMRKMEYAHAKRADIDPINKTIRIRPKPKYGWTPKTRRGVREIPIGDSLIRDLLARADGLLFPNTEGNPNIRIDRIFEEIGKAAGIVPPSNDRACWVHRWRDTTATRQLALLKFFAPLTRRK